MYFSMVLIRVPDAPATRLRERRFRVKRHSRPKNAHRPWLFELDTSGEVGQLRAMRLRDHLSRELR
jgi:hypothetical protein